MNKDKAKKKRDILLHKRAIKEMIKGKSRKRALMDAGYTENTAWKKGKRTIDRIAQNGGLKLAMEKAGLTDEYLAMGIKECTQATKKTYAQFKGIIVDEREDPDFAVRKNAIDLATILRGDKTENLKIEHTLGEMTPDEVEDALKKANEIVNKN